jgi:hypothetical protein
VNRALILFALAFLLLAAGAILLLSRSTPPGAAPASGGMAASPPPGASGPAGSFIVCPGHPRCPKGAEGRIAVAPEP